MARFFENLERWYFRYSNYIPKLILGLLVGYYAGGLISSNSFALPPGWDKLAYVVIAGLFLLSEGIGVVGTLLLFGWMLYNSWSLLGIVLGSLSLISLVVVRSIFFVILHAFRSARNRAQMSVSGDLSFFLLSPFLVNGNLGFVIPLSAGLNFGVSGPAIAVAAGLISTLFFMMQGLHVWAFLLPGGQSVLDFAVQAPEDITTILLSSLPPELRPLLGQSIQSLGAAAQPLMTQLNAISIVSGFWNFVSATFKKELLAKPIFILQPIFWGIVALVMGFITSTRTSTAWRLLAVGVGMAMLSLGYYYFPYYFGIAQKPYWPGGAGLFWYYLLVSAAISLLPKLIVTGRYAPVPEPVPVVVTNQTQAGSTVAPRLEGETAGSLLNSVGLGGQPQLEETSREDTARSRTRRIEF